MKYIFTGGGTAGHINPALAMIEEIREWDKGAEFLFIGRREGGENEAVKRAGISCREISAMGLRRQISPQNLKCLIKTLKGRREAKEIIREFGPDAVIGTGGYVSWPVISAARGLGIPTAIHESNISPGLTTRMLAGKVDLVMLADGISREKLGHKGNCRVVGIPLRKEFFTTDRRNARARLGVGKNELLIVSFGGSIGAERLNEAALYTMRNFSEKNRYLRHIHALGKRYYESVDKGILPQNNSRCKAVAYIDDMPTYLYAADIVIARAGAITLAELEAVGVAAILIPSPNVTDNHQYKNAKRLSSSHAAIMIEEEKLTGELLTEKVRRLCENRSERERLSASIKRLGIRGARRECREAILSIIKGTREKA